MADDNEIFLGTGAKGDPYHPGPMQRGDVVVPEPPTAPVEVLGADAIAADPALTATTSIVPPSSASTTDASVPDNHEVT